MRLFFSFLFIGLFYIAQAQSGIDSPQQSGVDTVSFSDSLHLRHQSSSVVGDTTKPDSVSLKTVAVYPKKNGVVKQWTSRDLFFYVLMAMVLLFASLRVLFLKYYSDVFRLFFQTTLKQRQLREQIMQAKLPGILSILFFFISAGFYIAILLQHFQFIDESGFWIHWLYSALALVTIYVFKFLSLKAFGWIFDAERVTNLYIFLVFIFNSIIGIFLLPFNVLLIYLSHQGYSIALWLSLIGISVCFFYRFILAFISVRNHVKINPFHFGLYIFALELLPLLLLFKGILLLFR